MKNFLPQNKRCYLEITNICNRKCTFCPGTTRSKIFVDKELVLSRLDKASRFAKHIYLHILGEPFLHPSFAEILSGCATRDIELELTTNGTLLSQKNIEALIACTTLRQINFSLHSIDISEKEIFDNILNTCAIIMERRSEVYINLRFWNLENDFSLAEKNDYFISAILSRFAPELSDKPFNLSKGRRSVRIAGRLHINFSGVFEWPSMVAESDSSDKDESSAYCLGLAGQFGVLADGSVTACCLDSEGAINLGNIDTENLDDILSSPRAISILDGFKRGIASEKLCAKCTYRQRFNS